MKRPNSSISLRYRIAVTVFLLETIMLVTVLYTTLTFIETQARKDNDLRFQTVFQLIESMSRIALFSRQYDVLQQYIEQLSQDPQIISVNIANQNNITVVSDEFSKVGSSIKRTPQNKYKFVYTSELDGMGLLVAEFSYGRMIKTINEARDLGIFIALIGISIIGIASLSIGFFLTRRLVTLTTAVSTFRQNRSIDEKLNFFGNDEVGKLGSAFMQMAKEINDYVADLTHKQQELIEAQEILEERVESRTRELKELNKKLQTLSERDELTGIANRRKLESTIEAEIASAKRTRKPLALIMIDVDYFKVFNDAYGHIEGDFALRALAQSIKSSLSRKTDFVARYGGEEFSVVLPATDKEGAKVVAEIIRRDVELLAIPHNHSETSNVVTVSQGIEIFNEELDKISFIANADKALYAAKLNGRNCVQNYALDNS